MVPSLKMGWYLVLSAKKKVPLTNLLMDRAKTLFGTWYFLFYNNNNNNNI